MEISKLNAVITQYKDFIPSEQMLVFKNALTKASDESYNDIITVPVKNPTTVLLLSIFLGGLGVDRFYIGDTGLGIAKLLLGWLTAGIWPLIDIFMSYKKVKQMNMQNLLMALN